MCDIWLRIYDLVHTRTCASVKGRHYAAAQRGWLLDWQADESRISLYVRCAFCSTDRWLSDHALTTSHWPLADRPVAAVSDDTRWAVVNRSSRSWTWSASTWPTSFNSRLEPQNIQKHSKFCKLQTFTLRLQCAYVYCISPTHVIICWY